MSINSEYHAGIAQQNDMKWSQIRLRRLFSCCIGEVGCFLHSPIQNSDAWESSRYTYRCCSSLRSKKYVGEPDSNMSITTQLSPRSSCVVSLSRKLCSFSVNCFNWNSLNRNVKSALAWHSCGARALGPCTRAPFPWNATSTKSVPRQW